MPLDRTKTALGAPIRFVEALFQYVEAAVHRGEAAVDRSEARIHAPRHLREPSIHVLLELRNRHTKAADHSIVLVRRICRSAATSVCSGFPRSCAIDPLEAGSCCRVP